MLLFFFLFSGKADITRQSVITMVAVVEEVALVMTAIVRFFSRSSSCCSSNRSNRSNIRENDKHRIKTLLDSSFLHHILDDS